ncbi:sensor histidine kinase [Desulfurobacterium atlanticum]|uniref:histidine kinase n=1 Tax=Desulfurobacterium atlanticum TaxID=240169 RepID=A0A238ZT03_9BACT|nr:HAMP domain-containing sensor histidine kinase [Desulfurobacterium atlanticum]SNR86349.1 Signal transduction histidine kinase [Desulfurobacterium atlanticum]
MKRTFRERDFLKDFFLYYKLSRVIFAVSLLLIILSLSFLREGAFSYTNPAIVIFIYSIVAMASLFYKKENPLDFLLDIIFISALIRSNLLYWDYVSILYLFPIFFSSLFLEKPYTIIFPVISLIIYGGIIYTTGYYSQQEILIKLFLNGVAFFSIYFAGKAFEKKLKTQSLYILELEKEKRKNEVFKRLYHISADLAHEIKNPVASIKAAVELLDEAEKPNRKLLNLIKKETIRLSNIVNDFLILSRPLDMQKSEISIIELIKNIVDSLKVIHPDKKTKVNLKTDRNLKLLLPYKSFFSAISNLIKNSFEWAESEVEITVEETEKTVKIIIKDDGPGIKKEHLDTIFEPFFTTKKEGSGLGLAIAKRVAIELGGNLTVKNSPEKGAIFIFEIPKKKRTEDESAYS